MKYLILLGTLTITILASQQISYYKIITAKEAKFNYLQSKNILISINENYVKQLFVETLVTVHNNIKKFSMEPMQGTSITFSKYGTFDKLYSKYKNKDIDQEEYMYIITSIKNLLQAKGFIVIQKNDELTVSF